MPRMAWNPRQSYPWRGPRGNPTWRGASKWGVERDRAETLAPGSTQARLAAPWDSPPSWSLETGTESGIPKQCQPFLNGGLFFSPRRRIGRLPGFRVAAVNAAWHVTYGKRCPHFAGRAATARRLRVCIRTVAAKCRRDGGRKKRRVSQSKPKVVSKCARSSTSK